MLPSSLSSLTRSIDQRPLSDVAKSLYINIESSSYIYDFSQPSQQSTGKEDQLRLFFYLPYFRDFSDKKTSFETLISIDSHFFLVTTSWHPEMKLVRGEMECTSGSCVHTLAPLWKKNH